MKTRWYILIAVLVVVVLFFVIRPTRSDRKEAVANSAQQYAKEMGYTFLGASGSTDDSDGDGYIAVDIRVEDNGTTKTIPLECTYSYIGRQTGCKMRVVGIKMKQ